MQAKRVLHGRKKCAAVSLSPLLTDPGRQFFSPPTPSDREKYFFLFLLFKRKKDYISITLFLDRR